ncbi:MAG: recombinase family protein [Chloroflexota bacterium]
MKALQLIVHLALVLMLFTVKVATRAAVNVSSRGTLPPPGTLVIIYLRHSPGDGQSIDSQEAAVRQFCDANGWIIVKIYRDIGISGKSTEERAGFERMIWEARQKPRVADLLIIWDFSRFARNMDHAMLYTSELRVAGWQIVSMQDNIPDGSVGRLYEALIHWKNEMARIDIQQNTRRGLHHLAVQGYLPGGTPPKGFVTVEENLGTKRFDGTPRIAMRCMVDESIAPSIQRAFEMKVGGYTLREIARQTAIFPPDAKGSWNHLFHNPAYAGVLRYGGEEYEGVYPPILTQGLFRQVQEVMARNRAALPEHSELLHPRRLASSFVLSGRAHCQTCGSTVVGSQGKGQYSYYRCKVCKPGWNIPAEELEQLVLDHLVNVILEAGTMDELLDWTNALLSEGVTELSDRYLREKQVHEQLVRQAVQITRNLLLMPSPTALALQVQREHEEAVAAQQELVSQVERNLDHSRVRLDKEDVKAFLSHNRSMLRMGASQERDHVIREVLDLLVSEITLSPAECVIHLHVPDYWL